MNKDTADRKKFIKKCIDNSKDASLELLSLVDDLWVTESTSEKINIISKFMHLSPETIWRDYLDKSDVEKNASDY